MKPVTVSIIICTRNRASDLLCTLQSIQGLRVPQEITAELIIVDNASTDETRSVVSSFDNSMHPPRYVYEEKPGLSRARNAGLANARGQIILFTDDDIRVPSDWVEAMCTPIIKGTADAVAGGVILGAKQAFLTNSAPYVFRKYWYATTDTLDPDTHKEMIGANMAFHRKILDRVPKFDESLGAGALGQGEETLFSLQAKENGFIIVAAFEVRVVHMFSLDRLSAKALVSAAKGTGRSQAYIRHHFFKMTPRWVKLKKIKHKLLLGISSFLDGLSKSNRGLPSVHTLECIERVELYAAYEKLKHERPKY